MDGYRKLDAGFTRFDVPSENYGLGDMVWSRVDLQNDGGIPELDPDVLLAGAGTRGVVVRVGSVENKPEISIYLVRFEDAAGVLGPPVGCLGEELTQDETLVDVLASRTQPAETSQTP